MINLRFLQKGNKIIPNYAVPESCHVAIIEPERTQQRSVNVLAAIAKSPILGAAFLKSLIAASSTLKRILLKKGMAKG
jgi:hypothetical protein